jgi:folate-binding Fe-S cluster repair protein YgfZ
LTAFTSFYTHNPNWFFPFSDKLVTIKDNNLYYLHNIYDVNSDIREERVSKIQFVVNKDITNTKVFDNVMFNADLHDNTNSIPNIIKNITFSTQKQTTKPFNHFDEVNNSSNVDYREDTYRFAIPREAIDNDALHQLNS